MNAVSVDTVAPAETPRRLRALVIAELANPDWVSVPLEGWAHWHALSKIVDGHLVTHVRNRENILKYGETRVSFIDTRSVEDPVYRMGQVLRGRAGGGLTTLTALSVIPYYYFERLLWQALGDRIRAGEWEVVHRLTPLTPTTPSFLAAKCAKHGVPFVMGPLNGGVPWPKGFSHARLAEREWLTYVRDAYKLLPGYSSTRRFSSALVTGSRDTRSQIARPYQHKTVYIPENAVDPARFTRPREGAVELPLKVAFVGRLTLYKGADMLIEAAAPLVRDGRLALDIIGDGPQAKSLRELATREGLPDSIFAGWIQHDQLQDRLRKSDVFAFPSIREFGGAVVLEAMALGLVPIVMDYGGPGELVTEKTGFLLPMGSRSQVVAALGATLQRIVSQPSDLRPIAARARARVFSGFTWDAKAAQMLEVYRWVRGMRDKPNFGMPLPDPA